MCVCCACCSPVSVSHRSIRVLRITIVDPRMVELALAIVDLSVVIVVVVVVITGHLVDCSPFLCGSLQSATAATVMQVRERETLRLQRIEAVFYPPVGVAGGRMKRDPPSSSRPLYWATVRPRTASAQIHRAPLRASH